MAYTAQSYILLLVQQVAHISPPSKTCNLELELRIALVTAAKATADRMYMQ